MTTTYRIKDIATRSGFSAATLRYYEEIGLLPEADRTPGGYRLYDDRTLDRLAFIARTKQLGCSLDEIADLTIAWDGGHCGPVQDRLRSVVADKIAIAQQQIIELTILTADLRTAAATLEPHRPDGPCDDACGCVTTSIGDDSMPNPVKIGRRAELAHSATTIACTLGSQAMGGRLDDWHRLLGHATRREQVENGLRITFGTDTPCDELIRLVTAEQECCQFFRFAITVDTRGVALEIYAPDDAPAVLQSLFGATT